MKKKADMGKLKHKIDIIDKQIIYRQN